MGTSPPPLHLAAGAPASPPCPRSPSLHLVLEGRSSNRISIHGARSGGRLLNPVIPHPRETLVLLVRRNGGSTCWMKLSRSLEQMKTGALGTGRVEKTLERMGTGAAGQEWEDRPMMVPLNGKRLGGRKVTGLDIRN